MTSPATQYVKISAPEYADRSLHCVGMSPSVEALGAARKSLLHAATYRRSGLLCIGERDPYNTDFTYHVFYPAITTPDGDTTTTAKILFTVLCHDQYDSTALKVYVNGVEEYSVTTTDDGAGTNIENIDPVGKRITILYDAPVDSATPYNVIKVRVDGAKVASFTAVMLPETELTNAGIYWLGSGNFDAGLQLKGFDRTNGQMGSVDSLVQNQNQVASLGASHPTFLNMSRQCLWGWACGSGRFSDTAATGYRPFMVDSFRPYVRPRNLTNGTANVKVDICMAYRCDTGCKIKFTALTSGDSYEWTPTASTAATPAIAYAYGQLDIDPNGDEIKIEVYRTTTAAFELHALSIWETTQGESV